MGAAGTEGGQAGWDLCPDKDSLWFPWPQEQQSPFPTPAFAEKKSSSWWAHGRHHVRRDFSKISPDLRHLAMSQSGCGPGWWSHHSHRGYTAQNMFSGLETQAAFSLIFSLTWQDQKSCLNSKEQEHVRSLLVYLQRKQSMKLQRGLGWVCGTLQCQGCSPPLHSPRGHIHLWDFASAAPVPVWWKSRLRFSLCAGFVFAH